MSASLSISVVTYHPDLAILEATQRTLELSLAHARRAGSLSAAQMTVVDNGPGEGWSSRLEDIVRREIAAPNEACVRSGHGNVGYGRGNNLVLLASQAEFHLVINPDVALEASAIHEALSFMAANPRVVMLAPDARDPNGAPLHLCKRYPSVIDLALRGFAPSPVKRWFRSSLERYEMRDLPRDRPSTAVPLLSGSFMFCRRAPVAEIGGFSDDFFLYFEDFDLSLRAARRGELAWVPSVRITHWGGHAARKGWRHRRLFAASAVKFFNRHGWKWA
jgi:GT2 family glycosyltransferase